MNRRGFLHSAGAVGTGLLGGCFLAHEEAPPGSLTLNNQQDTPRTVTIRVEKTSNDPTDAGSADGSPGPATTPLRTWEKQYTVEGGEERLVDDFITEEGAYYIEARLQNGGQASYWTDMVANSEGNLGPKYIVVDVTESGEITIGEHGA